MSNAALRYATLAALSAVLAFTLAGCCGNCAEEKEALDTTADQLIKVLQKDDFAAFEAMSTPGLKAEITEAKFHQIAAVIDALGPFESLNSQGVQFVVDVWTSKYKATFAKGTVDLSVSTKEGKLHGFDFTGDAVEEAQKSLKKEAGGEGAE